MKLISVNFLLVVILLWPMSFLAQAGENLSRGQVIASFCITCHGQGIRGSLKIPQLSDLKVSDLKESMIGFKTGEERSTIMGIIAKKYSKEDIVLLAEYIAALPD